jgi:hypothetical protein
LALNVFQKIIDAAQEVDVDILIRMGDCHREVGDLEAAIVFYVNGRIIQHQATLFHWSLIYE